MDRDVALRVAPEQRPRNVGHPLAGGVAFVTGGASGIGRACAEAFAAVGSDVMIADRDEERGKVVAEALVAIGVRARFVSCDVRDAASVEAAVGACMDLLGRIDFAVNSAGLGGTPTSAPLAEMAIEAFDELVAVNLRGTFLSVRAELAAMSRQGSGSIVNIASAAALVGVRHSAAYAASKHGVLGLTRTAALDYAETGIRINAICPGMIATPMIVAGMSPSYQRAILSAHPMQRAGVPEEIASAALWLCGPGASFTTGIALPIDGGMTSV